MFHFQQINYQWINNGSEPWTYNPSYISYAKELKKSCNEYVMQICRILESICYKLTTSNVNVS